MEGTEVLTLGLQVERSVLRHFHTDIPYAEPVLHLYAGHIYSYSSDSISSDSQQSSFSFPLRILYAMATVPAALKSAGIAQFAQRAGQLEKVKPVVAYWCMETPRCKI